MMYWRYPFIFPMAARYVHARYTLLKRYEDAGRTTDSSCLQIIAAWCSLLMRLDYAG